MRLIVRLLIIILVMVPNLLFAKGNDFFKKIHTVFSTGDAKQISRYFSKDTIVHMNWDKALNRQGLIRRAQLLHKSTKRIKYFPQQILQDKNTLAYRGYIDVETYAGKTTKIYTMQMAHLNRQGKCDQFWELSLPNNMNLNRLHGVVNQSDD